MDRLASQQIYGCPAFLEEKKFLPILVSMKRDRLTRRERLGEHKRVARHPANGASVGPDRAELEAVSSTSVIAPTPTGRRSRRLLWNDGQDNLGGMLCV